MASPGVDYIVVVKGFRASGIGGVVLEVLDHQSKAVRRMLVHEHVVNLDELPFTSVPQTDDPTYLANPWGPWSAHVHCLSFGWSAIVRIFVFEVIEMYT